MKKRALAFAFVAALATNAFATKITIVNGDKPGVGFNDPTPATPVGGNPGTTRGEQRLNVLRAAAQRWENLVDSNVEIVVTATFAPIEIPSQPCTATAAILGAASPQLFKANFKNAPRQNVWYPVALANKLAGEDLEPARADIFAQFNAAVDNPTCLREQSWYYGLDAKHGNDVDLLVVVLHELAHGLGISGAARAPEFAENRPSVFDTHILDVSTGLRWDQMSPAQRRTSYLNTANIVWDGAAVRDAAPRLLEPITTLSVTVPAPVARNLDVGTATYGPRPSPVSISGNLVLAEDAEGTKSDGCTTLTNAAAMAGNIAVVDRGGCSYVTKTRNAQAAGARAVVVIDNERVESCAPPLMMSDTDTSDLEIPTLSIRAADGDLLKPQFASSVTVSATIRTDRNQLAGTSTDGYLRLYAPCTAEPGSSIHHWDEIASPNLLMEPYLNDDLLHGPDLTIQQLLDLGWTQPPRTGRRILKR